MVVLARTDPHATYDDVRGAHPDWIAVDAAGKPRRHWASPEMWVTCALGPYNFEFMTAVHREVMTRYKVDGIFINRWAGSGMCYCEHCRTNFRAATGHELPRTDDPQDPARRAYIVWHQERLFELWRLWDGEVRKVNPDSRVIPNAGGGATSPLDMKAIGELAPTLFADRQARSGLMPPWANGKAAKEYRAAMGNKPVGGIFSMGVEEAYRWKDSVQSEAEIRIWFADGVANGLRPWFTKFAGVLRDRRWLGVVEDLYRWHHGAERVPAERGAARPGGAGLLAADGLVLRRPEGEGDGRGPRAGVVPGADRGPDPVRDGPRPAPRRGPPGAAKTLILPNIAALSDEQCRQLRAFVERGGGLVATYETSLYDERGGRRADFGLADLFGVSFRRRAEGPMRNAYLRLEADPRTGRRHPLLAGLDDAPRIIHGTWRLDVTPRGRVRRPAADAHPELPRPADGDGLPPRPEDRHRRGLPARARPRAGWSTSPGTSTASSGRSWPSTTACCSATPSGGRPPRSRRSRSRAPACST